ncbi:MAG: 7-carboxy-7-deazaguanine synthase QueE [Pseudomonadota bacterium]
MATPLKTDLPADQRLKINEIFFSLQGESSLVGLPTVFIRLTGCPLRCQYCDTAYAFHAGNWQTLDDIVAQVAGFGAKHVCVTGGEPLAQKNCQTLMHRLCDEGYVVSIETSGAYDISEIDPRVIRVMDLKTPDSGELAKNRMENVPVLTGQDQVKFVLCSESDYEWAKGIIGEYGLLGRCQVLMSPSFEQLPAKSLAEWILRDKLGVRMQLQLHKLLWGDTPGH